MRGFLSKWFNRKAEEKSLPRSYREEPILSAKGKSHPNHPQTDAHDHVAHPDTEFLDYEDWNSENTEAPIAQIATSHAEELPAPELAGDNDVIPDTEWIEDYKINASTTQEFEIISETQISNLAPNLGSENQELIEIDSPRSETAADLNIEKWPDWINASVVPLDSLKGQSDPSGNTYLHYAAILGSPQLCVQLLKEGWDAECVNNLGQTAIDLARCNDRKNTALLMELFLSQKNTSSAASNKNQAETEPKAKTKERPSSENILKDSEPRHKTWTKKKQRETIRKSQLADDSNSDHPNNLSTTIEPRTANKTKRKNTPPKKPKISLSGSENALWNIMVRDSRCPNDVWGYLMDTKDTDISGNTLLHYATRAGNTSYSLRLLELGWGIDVKNNDGYTPLDVARKASHIDVIHALSENKHNSLNEKTADENIAEALSNIKKITEADHSSGPDNSIQQETQKITTPPNDKSEDLENTEQGPAPAKIIIDTLDQADQLKSKDESACIKCDGSFADFNTAIKLWFCPFCGAEQPDYDAKIANAESQSQYKDDDKGFSEKTSDDYQTDSVEEVFIEEVTYASTTELHSTERVSEENNQTQRSKSVPISFYEDPFSGVDESFDDEIIDIDLQSYQPTSRGRNSSDENYESLSDWKEARSENAQTEEWEIFLDEDLEEQSHPSDQYFEDEDPLEQGKIVEYASRLTSRITSYQSKDRRRIYAFFISILGDFPFYQSYAAIERLIAKNVQIDQIRDAYAVKLLWMTNPNIWSSRRYNRMENSWSVSRSPKLKNSMSWQLASDLVTALTPNELENLILNDWYTEWLNLPLHGGDTASGLDPAYSLYPTYLYEKRRLLMTNVNNW
jgi:ankyrin repeat protein